MRLSDLSIDLDRLKKMQFEIANSVVLEDKYRMEEVKHVVGVDQAFVGDMVVSCAVRLKYPELTLEEEKCEVEEVRFPYIPTFLMFREGDPAVKVVSSILLPKTVILVDGSGIAHPRRCGLATYVALKTGEAAIGITKRKLWGEEVEKNGETALVHDGEVIGYVLKTCKRCKPIYISPGSYISPRTSLEFVKTCLRGYKLPEPVRLAHNLATEVARKLREGERGGKES